MTLIGSLDVRGFKELDAKLARLGARGPVAVEGALFEFGSLVEGDAKGLAPVDTGNLRGSGFTLTASLNDIGGTAEPSGEARALARNTATEITAVVGFGGPSAPYAAVQHERTDYHHTVGQAKYLETPLKARSPELLTIIGARVDREILAAGRGAT